MTIHWIKNMQCRLWLEDDAMAAPDVQQTNKFE